MDDWLHITLIAVSIAILVLVLLLILQRCFCLKTRKNSAISDEQRGQSMPNGIARLHQVNLDNNFDRDGSKIANLYVFQHGVLNKRAVFDWADHPSLITDAVENGWSRFAFTKFISSLHVKSTRSLLGACASGDQENGIDVEICWELCEGSADFMQKIRLNPGLKKIVTGANSSMGAVSVIRAALPLPGPQVGNLSFPQEAYFEITILSRNQNIHDHLVCKEKDELEGEKIKLIGEKFSSKLNEDYLVHVTSSDSQRRNMVEEIKVGGKNEIVFLSVGFSGGGSFPLKIPGSYHESIGFNSSGSVYLDGTKLVLESEKDDWGSAEKVIGCGYNPNKKKVFFTKDSQLVHEVHCKSDEFGYPLYPTIAANTEITVLVNLGQSPFKFMGANRQRTPNPCFNRPLSDNSNSINSEDSRELFSIGRIDSQWLPRSATRNNNNTVNSLKTLEYDQESEGDLFEIVLDSTGRSPFATHQ